MVAADFSSTISSATSVITDLQAAIYTRGIYAARINPEEIFESFYKKFKAKSGKTFNPNAPGLIGEYRGHLVTAITEILSEHHDRILKGGQDAFVPAFFRANLLKKVNKAMGDRLSGNVITSEHNLINKDTHVNILFAASPLLKEISNLVQKETNTQFEKVIDNYYMSYRPMKLKASCLACHNRYGVQQQHGAYGGALIIGVKLF